MSLKYKLVYKDRVVGWDEYKLIFKAKGPRREIEAILKHLKIVTENAKGNYK